MGDPQIKRKPQLIKKTPLAQAFQSAQNRKTKNFSNTIVRLLLLADATPPTSANPLRLPSSYVSLHKLPGLLHLLIFFAWIVFRRMVWRKFCWWHIHFHIHGAAKKRDKYSLTSPLARICSISFSVGKRMVPSSLISMGKLSCLWLMTR